MENYDPAQVSLVVGGNIISGFSDGSMIKVSRDEATFSLKTGADGELARTRNHNRQGKVVVSLMQTSQSNLVLSSLHNIDELTGVPAGSLRLADALGNTVLSGDNCFIEKLADVGYSKDLEIREWTICVPKLDGVIGGAL